MNSSMGSVCPDSCLRRTVVSPPQAHQLHQHRLDYHHEAPMRQVHLPPPPQQYSDNCASWTGSDSYSSPSSSPAGSIASYQMRPQLQLRKVILIPSLILDLPSFKSPFLRKNFKRIAFLAELHGCEAQSANRRPLWRTPLSFQK